MKSTVAVVTMGCLVLSIAVGSVSARTLMGDASADVPLSSLTFQFVTELARPGQQPLIKRSHAALETPTPIDVNGDLLPDVVATLAATSTSNFTLSFRRVLPGLPLPLRAEAVITSPSSSLPRGNIYFGYDAMDASAPSVWSSAIALSGPATAQALDVTTTTQGAGSRIATVGGLFNGDVLTPSNPIDGSLAYAPVPSKASFGFTVGPAPQVRVGANAGVAATGAASITDGTRTRRVSVGFSALPSTLSVTYAQGTDADTGLATQTVTYVASGPIAKPAHGPSLSVNYSDNDTSTNTHRQAVATASGIPTGMTLTEIGDTKTTFTANGGSVGQVEGGFANGPVKLLPVDHPYALISDDGTTQSVAARVDNLQSASFDGRSDVTADMQLAASASEPADIEVLQPRRTITGSISNVPHHVTITYRPTLGQASYEAYGESITSADLTISVPDSQNPIFGRVRYLTAHIDALPPSITATFAPSGGSSGSAFETTSSVGAITVGMSDGIEPIHVLPYGDSGATIVDTPGAFSAWAMLRNLRGGSIGQDCETTGTPPVQVCSGMHAELHTGPDANGHRQNVTIEATLLDAPDTTGGPTSEGPGSGQTGTPATFYGTLFGNPNDPTTGLPDDVTIDQAADNTYTITTSSRIPHVTLSARNLPGKAGAGTIHNVDVTVTDMPQSVMIEDDGEQVVAPGGFGTVQLHAWDVGAGDALIPADGTDWVRTDTVGGGLDVQARVSNLSEVTVVNNGETQAVEATFTHASNLVNFESHSDSGDSTKPNVVQGQWLPADGQTTLPTNIVFSLDTSAGVHVIWNANKASQIHLLSVKTRSPSGSTLALGAPDDGSGNPALSMTLPKTVNFCIGGATDCDPASNQTYKNAITMYVQASDVVTVNGLICLDNGNTVAYDNCPSSHAKEIVLSDIEMENVRLELNRTKIVVQSGNDTLLEDGTKLYLDTDGVGLKIGRMQYLVPTQDPLVIHADLIRTHDDTTKPFVPFYGLAVDSIGNADNIHQEGSLDCQDLHIYQDQDVLGGAVLTEVTDNVIPDDWGQDVIKAVGCSGE